MLSSADLDQYVVDFAEYVIKANMKIFRIEHISWIYILRYLLREIVFSRKCWLGVAIDSRIPMTTECVTPNLSEDNRTEQKNYFEDLPTELKLKIFSYFKPRQLCELIAPVCKAWWILSKDITLWKSLSITLTSEESNETYCEILLRCVLLNSLKVKSTIPLNNLIECSVTLTHLKDLDIGFCKGLNPTIFATLVSNCPLIEFLNLEGCHPGVDINCVSHIVTLNNLTSLNLSHCVCVDDSCINIIAKKCQKLSLLNVDGVTRITDQAVRDLSEFRRDTLLFLFLDGEELTDDSMLYISSCKKLVSLKVSYGELFTDATLKALSTLPSLTWFKLRRSPHLSTDALSGFFSNVALANLKSLEIDSLSIDDNGLLNVTKTCKHLRHLALPWCWEISDDGLKAVISNCSSLRWLDLLGLYRLLGEPLIHIPLKLPNLVYLNLEQCNNIIDAIVNDLAKKMPHLRIFSYYGDEVVPTESDEEDAALSFVIPRV